MDNQEIESLLSALDNDVHSDLLDTSLERISKDKNDILQRIHVSKTMLRLYNKKLKNYRYIDEIGDFKLGYYLRWINITDMDDIRLTNGGIFIDMKVMDSGINIVCKNGYNKIFQINLNNCIVFQKLSDQEIIILNAFERIR